MQIAKALSFATEKHRGQTRKFNGEAYVNHCVRVGDTVATQTSHSRVIIAAILHDTLEDTETTFEELTTEFGIQVATMVLALTNNEEEMTKAGGKRAYLANKINTLLPDELLIKLADRLDNISDLTSDGWSRKYCEETRHIFLDTLSINNLSASHLALLKKIRDRVEECEALISHLQ